MVNGAGILRDIVSILMSPGGITYYTNKIRWTRLALPTDNMFCKISWTGVIPMLTFYAQACLDMVFEITAEIVECQADFTSKSTSVFKWSQKPSCRGVQPREKR